MLDLTLSRSYKISFSHLCSWITINLYRRHQRRVLVRINWAVNPTKNKSLEKRKPPAPAGSKGSSARCGSAERPSSTAHSCSYVSVFNECLFALPGACTFHVHLWTPPDSRWNSSASYCWLEVSERAIDPLFDRQQQDLTGVMMRHCGWLLCTTKRKLFSYRVDMNVCLPEPGWTGMASQISRQKSRVVRALWKMLSHEKKAGGKGSQGPLGWPSRSDEQANCWGLETCGVFSLKGVSHQAGRTDQPELWERPPEKSGVALPSRKQGCFLQDPRAAKTPEQPCYTLRPVKTKSEKPFCPD